MGADLSHADSLKFRDAIKSWIDQGIKQADPGPKYGLIQGGTGWQTGYQSVILNGETTPQLYPLGTISASAVGAVALIEGPNNNRRITDILGKDVSSINVAYVNAYDTDLAFNSVGTTVGRNIVNNASAGFYFRLQPVGGGAITSVLTMTATGVYVYTMPTTASAANVRWAGTWLYQVTSFSDLKTDIELAELDYDFLKLNMYTWRDAQEVERFSETDERYAGVLLEEVAELGYDEFIDHREDDGDIMGVSDSKFYTKHHMILRDVVRRLNVLEGKLDGEPAVNTWSGETLDPYDRVSPE